MANKPKDRTHPLTTWLLLKSVWDSGAVGSARALWELAGQKNLVPDLPSVRSISQRVAEWRNPDAETSLAELQEVARSELRKRFVAQGVTDDKIVEVMNRGIQHPDVEIALKYVQEYNRMMGLYAPVKTEQRTDIHVHDDRAADEAYERRMREIECEVANREALPGRALVQVTDNTDDVEAGQGISDALPYGDEPDDTTPGGASQPNQDDR